MQQLGVIHPENLANQQFIEVFPRLRIAGEQQDTNRGRHHERAADDSFLHSRPFALAAIQQNRPGQCRTVGDQLYCQCMIG